MRITQNEAAVRRFGADSSLVTSYSRGNSADERWCQRSMENEGGKIIRKFKILKNQENMGDFCVKYIISGTLD